MTRATQKKILQTIEVCRDVLASTGWRSISWLPVQQQLQQLQELLPEDASSVAEIVTSLQQALQVLPEEMDTTAVRETRELVSDLLDTVADQVISFPVKKLIVFLPYKASMWDSLESIWRAAMADRDHCEAVVVPIPYADRDKNMGAKKWYCEADQFPPDVPVADWHQYRLADLERMHPDAIFFHNSYDDQNFVTSVDSDYYSSNLKKCTDNLIYVPYFVTGDTISPDFCQADGVVNADHVIVENEKIKKAYEENYLLGTPPAGKFLALGSPKFDKVIGHTRDEYELPPAWQKLLHGKKSVLYNIGLRAMLRQPERFVEKIRQVLETFRNRDDVVLWWRPHPLMASTFQSMRPDYYEAYREIVEAYKKEGWGIYDDTSDLDRSIICTDAYYGDPSTVVWLYRAAGKPVVLQDYTILDMQEPFDIPVWSYGMCSDGKSLWFVEGMLNFLIRYTPATRDLRCVARIPGETLVQDYAFQAPVYADGRIYLVPLRATQLLSYEPATGEFDVIDFPTCEGLDDEVKFQGAFRYREWIYLIPSHVPWFLRLHIKTNKIEKIADLRDICHQLGLPEDTIVGDSARADEQTVFATIYKTPFAMLLDMEEMTIRLLDTRSLRQDFCASGCGATAKYLYISSIDGANGVGIFDHKTLQPIFFLDLDLGVYDIRNFNDHQVIVDNFSSGEWFFLNEDGNFWQEEQPPVRSEMKAFQPAGRNLFTAHGQQHYYATHGEDCGFYTMSEEGKILCKDYLNLKNAKGIPPEGMWNPPLLRREFPGFDIAALCKAGESTDCQREHSDTIGTRIYQAVMAGCS